MANRCIFDQKSCRRNGNSKENAYSRQYEEHMKVLCENFPPLQANSYETKSSPQRSPLQEQRCFNNKPRVKKDWAEMVEEEEMQEQRKKSYKERHDVPQRIKDVRAWRDSVKRQQQQKKPYDTWGTLYKEEVVRNEMREKAYAVERYWGDANRDKTYGDDYVESLEDLRLTQGIMTSTPSKHAGSKRPLTDSRKESPKQATVFEKDPAVLKRRQKQIDYGKNTLGYQSYTSTIRKSYRTKNDPRTPDKHIKYSRNSWDMQIKLWRKKLHNWDPPSNDQANESCDLDFDLSSEISFDTSETASSVPASSSSPDFLTQEDMDVGYGSSPFQDAHVLDSTLNDSYNSNKQLAANKSTEEGFCDLSDLEVLSEECTYLGE